LSKDEPYAAGDFPQEIILEVTNRCNLRCVMCHFHGKGAKRIRPIGDMPKTIWSRVLKDIETSGRAVSLLTHGAGEPLLYGDLFLLLAEARRIRNVSLGFMTNGMALTPEVSRSLLDIGVDWLAFSIDGVEPETHSRYRVGSDLRLIDENLDALIRLKRERGSKTPVLFFNMVGLPELEPQREAYVKRWLPHAEQVMISTYRPIGSRRFPKSHLPSPRKACLNPFRQMVISWEGVTGLCCEDIHCEVATGDVRCQSIKEIWYGEALSQVRKAHLEGRFEKVPFCVPCDTWAAGEIIREDQLPEGTRRETLAQVTYIAHAR
jgi:wyosine [tRNA(Phe)-imidazoG37] synthetase (radical SAM superfamily)